MGSRSTGKQRLVRIGLAAMLCLHMASLATAQRGRGFGFGPNRAQLATLKEVQEELQLTDEQAATARKAARSFNAEVARLFRSAAGDIEKVRGGMPALREKARSAVMKVLSEPQRKRLDEIYVQQNGVNSVFDARVRKALKLSDEQMSELMAARAVNREAGLKAMREAPPGETSEGRAARFEALWKKSEERILGVLTDKQKKQFASMRGEELPVNLLPLFPPPPMPPGNASRGFDE